jgi:hypothetical protein
VGADTLVRDRLTGVVPRLRDAFERRSGLVERHAAERVLHALESDYRGAAAEPEDDRLVDLAGAFGLTEVDELLLTLAVAPELDPTFATAYSLLRGDPTAVRISAGLALELAGGSALDAPARARLAPGAPLRSFDLLDVVGDAPFPLRSLRVPERVGGHLAGEEHLDPLVATMLVAPVPVQLPESQQVADALRAGGSLVWVTAEDGSAGLGISAAGLEALDAAALTVDLRRRPPGTSITDALRVALREAGLLVSGLVIAGAELIVSEAGSSGLRLLERSPVPVVALSTESWSARWSSSVPHLVVAPVLGPELRGKLWLEHVNVPMDADPQQWAALVGLRLSPEQIAGAARHAGSAHRTAHPGQRLNVAQLRESAKVLGSSGIKGAVRVRAQQTFADLALPPLTMQPLREIVQRVVHRDAVLGQGPVGGKHGPARGITALFTGPPGTGKSLAAHVLAGELGLDLLTVDLSAVVDKYIGETEKHLERLLSAAEGLNAVLLFDEADSLFGSRSGVHDARDRYANQEVAYLLQRIERFSGVAILTTNFPGNVDAAFTRRLSFVVTFPNPDPATRLALWRSHLSALATTSAEDPIDEQLLAQHLELAGGDIRNIVLAAAYAAADEGTHVGMRHINAAAEVEYRKLGRRLPGLS